MRTSAPPGLQKLPGWMCRIEVAGFYSGFQKDGQTQHLIAARDSRRLKSRTPLEDELALRRHAGVVVFPVIHDGPSRCAGPAFASAP